MFNPSNFSHRLVMFMYMLLFQLAAGQHVNFTRCYEKVQQLNTSDPDLCERWDITHEFRIQEDIKALTLDGCLALCGDGYQLWPVADTAKRFGLFILPILLLASSVASSPRLTDSLYSLVHLFGAPIDFLWSTMVRQEIARRNYSIAYEYAPCVAQDVAGILTAYDQWWQNATDNFIEEIKRRLPRAAQNGTVPQERRVDHLSEAEILHIRQAAFKLCDNRSTNPKLAWGAMLLFLASLTGAYIRVATTVNNNQTGHTLAVVMLYSWLIFAVYISVHVGIFNDPRLVIQALDELHSQHSKLFLRPESKLAPAHPIEDFADRYIHASKWAGGNNSWRPDKSIYKRNPENSNSEERIDLLIFSLSIAPLFISWIAAVSLSYYTPLKGFGCRSVAWISIFFGWNVSALTDFLSCYFFGLPKQEVRAQWLWRILMVKDVLIVVGSFAAVGMAQAGIFNRCECMASIYGPRAADDPVCIDLGPVSQEARDYNWLLWLIIPLVGLFLIYFTIYAANLDGERGRLLYLRTNSERRIELKLIRGSTPNDGGEDSNMGDSIPELSRSDTSSYSLRDMPPQSSIHPRASWQRDSSPGADLTSSSA